MRPRGLDGMRTCCVPVFLTLCLLAPVGCVSTDTHTKTLTELTAAKKTAAQQAAELEALRKQSDAHGERLQQQLASLQQNLDQESSQRKSVEASVAQLQGEIQQAQQQAESLTRERDALRSRSEDLQAKLDALDKDKAHLNTELGDVRSQIQDLEQKLASGNASAQDQISRLQQRANELEGDAGRMAKEREQLRQEQSQLAATLEQERQRLKMEEADKARLREAQSQLAASLEQERQRLKIGEADKAQLAASLEQERQRLKTEEADKARLEQERAAKEEEIKRLTRTQEELSRSLRDEIAKGTITIQQVRDRLTINMVDRVLFDSGQAQIKPAGIKVLKQVGDVLKTVTDKQIRIEGHTDNVPISIKLQDRFKTNWELSTARATTVVRYLIDQGGVDRQSLSAVGYAETHPVASNETDEGRSANRRIEIILYPKDLQQVTGQLTSGTVAH
jgi:chemotaxis protein MotB